MFDNAKKTKRRRDDSTRTSFAYGEWNMKKKNQPNQGAGFPPFLVGKSILIKSLYKLLFYAAH
jgi:hypothetical protein